MITSCTSHEQKGDEAFDQFRKLKNTNIDSNQIFRDQIKEIRQEELRKHYASLEDWTKYQNEIEKKIGLNENKIQSVKANPLLNAKSLRRISSLEKDNNNLKKKLAEYRDDMKSRLQSFKTSMNRNVIEIDKELTLIKVSNNK